MKRTDLAILEAAISEVEEECTYLSTEQAAFEEFRESVRLATPEPAAETNSSKTTENLKETYRTEVMDELNYGLVYGDSLSESLEKELSPSLANALLSNDPLTQRRKRDLLVETTVAIERREQFRTEIGEEKNALETFAEELDDIKSSIEALPECSPQQQLLEDLIGVWEQYETLENRCKRLLEHRQNQIRDASRSAQIFGDHHALHDYLYEDLETSYPVLVAIAGMIEQIDSNRTGREWSEMIDRQKTS